MAKLTLTYLDINGGRGEPARLAMKIGGIAFEDRRIPFRSWPAIKAEMPFEALPVLDVDGARITQCNAINRFVGKLAGLYPADALQAASCDEVMDAVEDITTQIGHSFVLADGPEKKAARARLAEGPISLHLRRFGAMLAERGGSYFADDRLTVADLKVFVWIRSLRSGVLDHVPTDLTDRVAPSLVEHCERVLSQPAVAAHYEARRAART
jgi:prostaglandin-H2 D-isomerase / glutathione transferase